MGWPLTSMQVRPITTLLILISNFVEMHLVGSRLLCNICLGCGQHHHISACGGPASCSVHHTVLWVCLYFMPLGRTPDVCNVNCAGGGPTPATPGPAPGSAAPPTSTPGPQAAEQGATQPPGREYFYKTRLCDKFMSGAGCPYGARCHYAHGEHELRNKGETKVGPQQLERLTPCLQCGGIMSAAVERGQGWWALQPWPVAPLPDKACKAPRRALQEGSAFSLYVVFAGTPCQQNHEGGCHH